MPANSPARYGLVTGCRAGRHDQIEPLRATPTATAPWFRFDPSSHSKTRGPFSATQVHHQTGNHSSVQQFLFPLLGRTLILGVQVADRCRRWLRVPPCRSEDRPSNSSSTPFPSLHTQRDTLVCWCYTPGGYQARSNYFHGDRQTNESLQLKLTVPESTALLAVYDDDAPPHLGFASAIIPTAYKRNECPILSTRHLTWLLARPVRSLPFPKST